ncbi:MAG TPA: 23S rRNA (pseudouridine(1915)-N(3))-methyltransferase RlmH [Clostridiaceae bacterium]|jgi:23S rRNA (pseudouridine1915-N3)-methyltransferase|nr:23S rRNA (pseudouridine(1915)-N(3))-methyltransferase RlmH [Clostridiaceae bacterium]
MLHINIICVGKLKEKYLQDALSEYSKRLSKYCNLNIIELPDEKLPNNLNDSLINQIKQKESNNILSHIEKGSYVLALDLKGKQFSSEEFSKKITDISLNSFSSITFIIGGTLGLYENVLKNSNELICFSKMTFPHQLIRIFLLEQIFRAFKISNNETYHR